MRVVQIGHILNDTEVIPFLSDRTFLDFELVILSRDGIIDGKGNRKDPYYKRRNELQEFLSHKKNPLIILTPVPSNITLTIGARNETVPISDLLPIPEFTTENLSGSELVVLPKTAFTTFLNKWKTHFPYNGYFSKYSGTVIAETPHSKKTLAFYNESSIFIPRPQNLTPVQSRELFKDLFEIALNLNKINLTPLPEWTNNFFLPEEKEIATQKNEIKQQIKTLQQKLEESNLILDGFKNKKALIAGSGDVLEIEIEKVFRELDVEILKAERNRDDLIVKYDDKIAVIEIKGVSGSAAEKHAVQLEKFVSIYHEENERPKGILLVNSFNDKPLNERIEKTFPDQMLRYSVAREHCLITTTQLLCLYFEAMKNPSTKKELIESLFNTNGVYEGFNNWEDYISFQEIAE